MSGEPNELGGKEAEVLGDFFRRIEHKIDDSQAAVQTSRDEIDTLRKLARLSIEQSGALRKKVEELEERVAGVQSAGFERGKKTAARLDRLESIAGQLLTAVSTLQVDVEGFGKKLAAIEKQVSWRQLLVGGLMTLASLLGSALGPELKELLKGVFQP